MAKGPEITFLCHKTVWFGFWKELTASDCCTELAARTSGEHEYEELQRAGVLGSIRVK